MKEKVQNAFKKKKSTNLSSSVIKEMFFSRCSSTVEVAVIAHCSEQCFSIAKLVLLEQTLRLGLTSSLELGGGKWFQQINFICDGTTRYHCYHSDLYWHFQHCPSAGA